MKLFIWRFTLKNTCITLFLCLLILITLNYWIPRYPEPIYYQVIDQKLSTIYGENINLKKICTEQNTLLIFISDSSSTAIRQIKILSQLDPALLQFLNVIFIHCGRITQEISELIHGNYYILIDPDAELARKMNIYILPTTILLTKEGRQILYSQKLVTSTELIDSIQRLKNHLP